MAEERPQPLQPCFAVHNEVSRLFQELIYQPWGARRLSSATDWQPCCDVAATNAAVIVEVELPGVERQDVHVEVEGDMLRITGERRETMQRQGCQYHRTECGHGRFERQLRLPAAVDRTRIGARFQAGILTITLPKKRTVSASSRARKEA